MNIHGPNQLLEDVFTQDLCVACGACVDMCPYFKTYRGKTAMVFPCTRETGRCFAHCPKIEVDLDELSQAVYNKPYDASDIGPYIRVVMAKAGDKLPAGRFQTGGAVSALVATALETGMIQSAILTDKKDMVPIAREVTTTKEVISCATSKYTAAPTVAGINRAVKQGHTQIGVVGTPCQVTATALLRRNPLAIEDFVDPISLVIGLFCTWSVDARKLMDLVEEEVGKEPVRYMDMPPPPAEVLVVETENRTVQLPLEKVRPLIPAGCWICPDMTSEWADVSVGVAEGISGKNVVIIRTQKGEELVKQATERGYLVTEELPQENFANLCVASKNKKKRAFTQAKTSGLVNTQADKRAALRVPEEVLDKITA